MSIKYYPQKRYALKKFPCTKPFYYCRLSLLLRQFILSLKVKMLLSLKS